LFLLAGAVFHNSLILQYKDVLMSEYSAAEGEEPSQSMLTKTRAKLIKVIKGFGPFIQSFIRLKFVDYC
jgi:hypothetical protein